MTLANTIIYGTKDDLIAAINKGEDIEEVDEYGYTPLTETAIMNKVDMAEYLLQQGAKVNEPDMTGRTALHWAADNNNLDLCKVLLKHKADPNAYTIAAQPLLVNPLLRDQKKLVNLLLKHGADLDFAKDYINTKLLGHLFMLQGVADIPNHEGVYVEVSFEGFYLEFTLNAIRESLHYFIHHFSARHLRQYFGYLRPILNAFENAAELIQYQQYSIDKSQHEKRIRHILDSKVLLLPVAYEGHGIGFMKIGDFWARCDRGEYGRKHGCINLHLIQNPKAINYDLLYSLLYTRVDGNFITKQLNKKLKLQHIGQIPISEQTAGNCSWANMEGCIPTLLLMLFQLARPSHKGMDDPDYIKNALYVFNEWLTWQQDRALDECIKSFHEANPKRKASKAAILAAVLLQQCHYENFKNIDRVNKILKILMIPQYHYILRSYINAYTQPKMTAGGKNLLELLESCGITPDDIAE